MSRARSLQLLERGMSQAKLHTIVMRSDFKPFETRRKWWEHVFPALMLGQATYPSPNAVLYTDGSASISAATTGGGPCLFQKVWFKAHTGASILEALGIATADRLVARGSCANFSSQFTGAAPIERSDTPFRTPGPISARDRNLLPGSSCYSHVS